MAIRIQAAAVMVLSLTMGACHTGRPASHTVADSKNMPAPESRSMTGGSTPATAMPSEKISDLSASDLHDVLSMLDNNHHDRMKLAFWVSTPFRSADPAFKTFYKERGVAEKELANELESWAKAHHVNLTYSDGTDTFGKAQTIMAKRQEKLVRGDDKDDFDRDMLIDEWQDYEFGISLVTAFLPSVHDPLLQAYLQKSLHSQEAASQQILMLFKKFKYTG